MVPGDRGDRAMKELINALRPSYNWLAGQLQDDTVVIPNYDAVCNNIENNLNNNNQATNTSVAPNPSSVDDLNLKDMSSKLIKDYI